jgi:hydroxypyruvate reductase
MRSHIVDIYEAAVRAVQPQVLLPEWVDREGDRIRLGDQVFDRAAIRHFYVVAIGKAAAAMADMLEQVLDDAISEGLVITKDGYRLELQYMRCLEAGHPVPDHRSLEAAYALENLLRYTTEKDLVLVLLSGGASALVADLVPGVQLDALMTLFRSLLRSGADIRDMNAVRKHFSRLKGGQLTRIVHPAQLVCLALSDVIGDAPDVIGSGPTVADPTTFADAHAILAKYRLLETLDPSLLAWLEKGLRGAVADTPKPGDPIFARSRFHLIGNNGQALRAAAARAMELGYAVLKETAPLQGESREQALSFAAILERYEGPRPACILAGGETTVQVKGSGRGGRNQECALALAVHWLERPPSAVPMVLCAATDGTDGPTDAAGALVDGELLEWCREKGVDPKTYLRNNDAYGFFSQTNHHFFTGPTHTNVMDVVIALIS